MRSSVPCERVIQASKPPPFHIETDQREGTASTKSVLMFNSVQSNRTGKRYSFGELTPTKPGRQLGAEGNCTPGLCPSLTCLYNLNPASIRWHELPRTLRPSAGKTSCESCLFIVAWQMWSAACMN